MERHCTYSIEIEGVIILILTIIGGIYILFLSVFMLDFGKVFISNIIYLIILWLFLLGIISTAFYFILTIEKYEFFNRLYSEYSFSVMKMRWIKNLQYSLDNEYEIFINKQKSTKGWLFSLMIKCGQNCPRTLFCSSNYDVVQAYENKLLILIRAS